MSAKDPKKHLPLTLAALGVVFGDIGTSPLYAFETALAATGNPDHNAILGIASLVLWSLILIVTVKYVLLVMRADYHGEGGVFALLALLQAEQGRPIGGKLPLYALMLLFGAALLFGDGTITPAISVLSALEGVQAFDPDFDRYVIPLTILILAVLFSIQRFGTGRLGLGFGVVMFFWFLVLGGMGIYWVIQHPQVFAAFNPLYAIDQLRDGGLRPLIIMGSVVLAVTGVEALYADMGHFGRRAISAAWHFVALPALVLNYLGQAACALGSETAAKSDNLFFLMVPQGIPTLLLVGLATIATVIASQALISGVFSLSAQAQELGYFPRSQILHTSSTERGQVYVPLANWMLGFVCIMLVLTFRSSENLAAAYGSAVVGTMVTTTIALLLIMRRCWKWPVWKAYGIAAAILLIEIPFFISCLTKIPDGGYFPFLVALLLLTVMLTWHGGRSLILAKMRSGPSSPEDLAKLHASGQVATLPGQLVFVTSNHHARYATARAFELVRRGCALREDVILLSLVSTTESHVDVDQSVKVVQIGPRLWHVTARHGFMQAANAPRVLTRAEVVSGGTLDLSDGETFYVLGREVIVEECGPGLRRWRRALFDFLSRNVTYAPDYLFIPQESLIEFTWLMKPTPPRRRRTT